MTRILCSRAPLTIVCETTSPLPRRNGKPWTPDEDAAVTYFLGPMRNDPVEKVAKLLHRTERAVEMRHILLTEGVAAMVWAFPDVVEAQRAKGARA